MNFVRQARKAAGVAKHVAVRSIPLGVALTPFLARAADDGPDYSSVAAAVSVAGLIAGLTATAVVKIGPSAAKWGLNKLVSMFR